MVDAVRRLATALRRPESRPVPTPAGPAPRAWWRPPVINLGEESGVEDAAERDAIAVHFPSTPPSVRQPSSEDDHR